ncbi:hypothetical protein CcaCcLH18_14293 [Colletotrichum camelliae]|nr:hypothetical protein CcaCcLH18_14293 [Colletotrichum camelliae]
MKAQIAIVALATLLAPTHAALRQCAGTGSDLRYEPSGFLTSEFTQAACSAAGGSIDGSRKGNQKCCNVPDAKEATFNNNCGGQSDQRYPGFTPLAQPC